FQSVPPGGHIWGVWKCYTRTLRSGGGGDRRGLSDSGHQVARIRISRQADGYRPMSATSGPVSSEARLADVVRGHERLFATSLVCTFHGQIVGRRSSHAQLAAKQSFSRPSTAVCSCRVVPLPVHESRGA